MRFDWSSQVKSNILGSTSTLKDWRSSWWTEGRAQCLGFTHTDLGDCRFIDWSWIAEISLLNQFAVFPLYLWHIQSVSCPWQLLWPLTFLSSSSQISTASPPYQIRFCYERHVNNSVESFLDAIAAESQTHPGVKSSYDQLEMTSLPITRCFKT